MSTLLLILEIILGIIAGLAFFINSGYQVCVYDKRAVLVSWGVPLIMLFFCDNYILTTMVYIGLSFLMAVGLIILVIFFNRGNINDACWGIGLTLAFCLLFFSAVKIDSARINYKWNHADVCTIVWISEQTEQREHTVDAYGENGTSFIYGTGRYYNVYWLEAKLDNGKTIRLTSRESFHQSTIYQIGDKVRVFKDELVEQP